jgi:dUTP pyrophosphatase
MILPVKRLTETAHLPTRAHPCDAGLDLYADESVIIESADRALVDTGLSIAVPPGYVGLIWPRSGLAAKHGISVDAGVIDAGYRGPVKVLITNSERPDYEIHRGDKIAQLLIQPVSLIEPVEMDALDATERNVGGFGSTGL